MLNAKLQKNFHARTWLSSFFSSELAVFSKLFTIFTEN